MPLTITLAVLCVIGWTLALKKRKTKTVVETKSAKPWSFKAGDEFIQTEFGPIVLRVIEDRATFSEKKGFIIFPEGVVVTSHFNELLARLMPQHKLTNESLNGVPNSHRVWTTYHTKDERFSDCLEAVARVVEGKVLTSP